jgi:tetratricopeptide (TPR) repeat protein
MLRAFLGWDQKELAAHAGLASSTVWRYEKGAKMTRKSYEQIVAATGLPLTLVETCFLPAIRAGRAAGLAGGYSPERLGSAASDLKNLTEARRTVFATLTAELTSTVATFGDYPWEAKTWRFVERLCHESEALAAGDAERALKLGQMALNIAQRTPGKGDSRVKLEGYAWIFVGNALRVAGLLPKSEEAFAHAEKAWMAWKGATPISLAEWRLPDGKASLRRHQGRLEEALELHNRALILATPEVIARIMLNKAFTLEQRGELVEALSTLQEAEKRINMAREPRLRCVLEFNRVVTLCRLERFAEAAERLPVVKSIVQASDKALDKIRVIWLESKIGVGFGRRSEAAELLDLVRREFLAREIAYDAGLATLELAILYLEDGRGQEVRRIAAELAPVFAAQCVPRETLACVQLFCKAVLQETITVELARGWLDELSLRRAAS